MFLATICPKRLHFFFFVLDCNLPPWMTIPLLHNKLQERALWLAFLTHKNTSLLQRSSLLHLALHIYTLPHYYLKASIYPQQLGEQCRAFYTKTRLSKFSNTCKFHHPNDQKEPTTKVTFAGFSRREGEKACPCYMKMGTSKYACSLLMPKHISY